MLLNIKNDHIFRSVYMSCVTPLILLLLVHNYIITTALDSCNLKNLNFKCQIVTKK